MQLFKRKDLTAYYSFQDEYLSRGLLRNRRKAFPTTLRELKTPTSHDFCGRIVQGRWPEKQAIELDKHSLRLSAEFVANGDFALSAWVRQAGLGMVQGGNSDNAATLFALSDGVWTGWRIDLLFPSNRLVFQIAQGQTKSPIGVVSTIRIPPKTWTHIAVSRDSQKIRVFVNGLIAGEVKHDSNPTPIPPTSCLNVGYAGNGLCSAIIHIDELATFSSPPTCQAVLANALQTTSSPYPNQLLEEASRYFVSRDYEKAKSVYESLIKLVNTDPSLRATLTYRIGELNRLLKKEALALNIFKTLAQEQNIPAPIRSLALHDYLSLKEQTLFSSDEQLLNYTKNFYPDYTELAPASDKYLDAMIEYDFCLPLTPLKALNLD